MRLQAPRNLKEPVRWNGSTFRSTRVPARAFNAGLSSSGVTTAQGAMRRAAASISANSGMRNVCVMAPLRHKVTGHARAERVCKFVLQNPLPRQKTE